MEKKIDLVFIIRFFYSYTLKYWVNAMKRSRETTMEYITLDFHFCHPDGCLLPASLQHCFIGLMIVSLHRVCSSFKNHFRVKKVGSTDSYRVTLGESLCDLYLIETFHTGLYHLRRE